MLDGCEIDNLLIGLFSSSWCCKLVLGMLMKNRALQEARHTIQGSSKRATSSLPSTVVLSLATTSTSTYSGQTCQEAQSC